MIKDINVLENQYFNLNIYHKNFNNEEYKKIFEHTH